MPVFGINTAAISILAFNYGARKPQRITGTLKVSACSALVIMLLGLAAFQLVPDLLLGIFNPSDEFLVIGRSALRTISLSFPLAAIGIALSASFQALGSGIYSSITSLCRQLVVLLPAAFLLSLSGNVNAVWWSFPIAEVASILLILALYARIYKKKIRPLFD
jgi:Na+-driven multidrug efflux pump